MNAIDSLDPLLQAFWMIAIPSSIVFLLQAIMTFVGVDSFHGSYADLHGDLGGADVPFQLFSLRNLVNFMLGFGWTGVSCFAVVESPTLLVLLALAVGALFVYFFFWALAQVRKFNEDNTFKIANTLYKTAEVYLPIPQEKSGKGKIMISVNGSFHELEAVTEEDRIPTGTIVRVIAIEGDNVLLVEPI
jgi:membrane protein implicated in regulation of membrane protease activity